MRLLPTSVLRLSVRHVRKRVRIPSPSDFFEDDGLRYDEAEAVSFEHTKRMEVPRHMQHITPSIKAPAQVDEVKPKRIIEKDSEIEQEGIKTEKEEPTKLKPLKVAKALDFSKIPLEKQSVFLFPGQGSQFVGMGRQLLDCGESRNLFDAAKHILGYDLLKLCLDGPKETLDRTIHCQTAVFVTSLAAIAKLKEQKPEVIKNAVAAAGFSVGEYAALVFANSLSFAEALRIVKIRAEAMQKCSEAMPSGMVTVRINARSQLGEAMVHARRVTGQAMNIDRPVCSVANYLFNGMQVVGGDDFALTFLDQSSKEYNIEVVKRLPVSGAFHTNRMREAVEPVETALNAAKFKLPTINVYSNVTGAPYPRNIGRMKRNLADQIFLPVKWEQIQQLLFRMHVEDQFPRYFELGPGRQLGAMFYYVSKKAHKALTNVPV